MVSHLTSFDILDINTANLDVITLDFFNDGIPDKLDLFIGEGTGLKDLLSTQFVTTVNNGHAIGKACQINSFFNSRVSTTNNQEVLITEEGTITHRTVRYTTAVVLFFTSNTNMTVFGTSRNDNCLGLVLLVTSFDNFIIAPVFDTRHDTIKIFNAQFFQGFKHLHGQFWTRNTFKTRIIFNIRCVIHLSTRSTLLQSCHFKVGTSCIKCCSHPRRTSSNNNCIVHE